jgi:hypothetical protein
VVAELVRLYVVYGTTVTVHVPLVIKGVLREQIFFVVPTTNVSVFIVFEKQSVYCITLVVVAITL